MTREEQRIEEAKNRFSDDLFGTYHKYMFKCRKCGKIKWTKSI